MSADRTTLRYEAKVATDMLTCVACPEQHEGTLIDGSPFYFRYRHGYASLAVGGDDVRGRQDVGMSYGGPLDGMFQTGEEYRDVFSLLLTRLVMP